MWGGATGVNSGVGSDWGSTSCSGPSSGSVAPAVVPFVVPLFGCVCFCCSSLRPSCSSSSSFPVSHVLFSAVLPPVSSSLIASVYMSLLYRLSGCLTAFASAGVSLFR